MRVDKGRYKLNRNRVVRADQKVYELTKVRADQLPSNIGSFKLFIKDSVNVGVTQKPGFFFIIYNTYLLYMILLKRFQSKYCYFW